MRGFAAVAVVVACGGSTTGSIDAGPDVVKKVPCWGDARTVQNRTCTVNSDCAVVDHQADCCGTLVEEGVRVDQVDAVHNQETTANAPCSACGCPPAATTDESGATGGAYLASCDNGLCVAHAH